MAQGKDRERQKEPGKGYGVLVRKLRAAAQWWFHTVWVKTLNRAHPLYRWTHTVMMLLQ